jgi:hypothetical protein
VYHHLTYNLILSLFWGLLAWQMFRDEEPASIQVGSHSYDPIPVLFCLALIAARWPTLLLNEEINPDESQRIALALSFLHDPVPWRGADPTTGGPLNSYILTLLPALGIPLNYITARAVGLILLMISAICWYVAAMRLRDRFVAKSVVIPAVTFLCFAQHHNYTHYSTEILPTAVLSVAALVISSLERRTSLRLFIAALLLGAVPFTKLQASPLAIVGFLSILIFAWRVRGEPFFRTATTMIAGGLAVPTVMLVVLLATGTLGDAWRSYIVNGLLVSTKQLSLFDFIYSVVGYPPWKNPTSFGILIVALGLITLAGLRPAFLSDQFRGKGRWVIMGSVIYALTAVFVVWKPGLLFYHYLFFGIPAAIFLAAALFAPWQVGSPWQQFWLRIRNSVRPHGAKAAGLFLLACTIIGGLVSGLRPPPLDFQRIATQKPDPVAGIIHALKKNDRHLAVWGYMPKYYAITGVRPTTRDAMAQWQVREGPLKEYYRTRYLADFNKSRPNLLLDATGPGNFRFKDYQPAPLESFKRLYEIVRSNYVLLVTLRQCGTPHTRIFVSQTRLSELGIKKQAMPTMPVCLRNNEDLAALLRTLR